MITLIDADNYLYRLCATKAHPLKEFMYYVNGCEIPIVIWDGPYATKWRKSIYPQYKEGRKKEGLADFVYEMKDLARQMLECLDCVQIRVPEYEADDIIASLAEKYRGQVDYIKTNDFDLSGLGAPTDVTKDAIDNLRLYKTLVGDSSDRIIGLRGFGSKSWDKLSDTDKYSLEYDLDKQPDSDYLVLDDEKLRDKVIANQEELRAIWKIVGFRNPDPSLLDLHTQTSKHNEQGLEKLRKEYLLW